MPETKSKVHYFTNLWLVHHLRQDDAVNKFSLNYEPHLLYDKDGALSNYDGSPTEFIADGCCMWADQNDKKSHTHVCIKPLNLSFV